jgi:uncharacterized protein YcfL
MKALIITTILGITLVACSSEPQKSATNSTNATTAAGTPTPVITPQVHITPPVTNENSETSSSTNASDAPVEFTYTGITPDKEDISYKIKVKTAKPISQVDIAARYWDAQGNLISETTLAWQNIVKSKKQPIEQGKTYNATGLLEPGSTKVECKLKRVFFTDGSVWSAS